jgi:hypothetical protein
MYLAVLSSSGSAAGVRAPLALQLRWRLVTGQPNYAAANDRYAAIIKDQYPAPSPLKLIDEQTGRKQQVAVPGCSRPLSPMFGGPWLFVTCSYGSYELYNLTSHQWRAVALSSQCQGACSPVAVGRYWIKIDTDLGPACGDHCGANYFLQNIRTGELKPDPVTPGGRAFDDLNAVSGSAALCAPLRYPRLYDGAAQRWEAGRLTFDGEFAVAEGGGVGTLYTLERCRSSVRHTEPGILLAGSPFLSSRAMAWTYRVRRGRSVSFRLGGWLLPSTQRFTAALPSSLQKKGAVVAALSKRTVYVQAWGGQLWAASLLTPTKRRLHQ